MTFLLSEDEAIRNLLKGQQEKEHHAMLAYGLDSQTKN